MKEKTNILIFLVLSALVLQENANAQEFEKYYQKSGKLVQKLAGSVTGGQTIIWDDYGQKELTVTNMNMMGMPIEQSILYIDKDLYTWGNQEPMVKHYTDDAVRELSKRKYSADDYAKLNRELLKQNNFTEKTTESVLGKECVVWENPEGIKMWIWKNLTLQIDMNSMGMSLKYETTSLDLDIDVPAETFNLPKNKAVEEDTNEKNENKNTKMIEIMDNMSKTGNN